MQQILVWLSKANKTIKFVDPISYILSNYATVILCNPVSPPQWCIDGHWYCATPVIEPCGAPKELEPQTRSFWDEDFVSGLGGNIYSNTQTCQHKITKLIHHSRETQGIITSCYANEDGTEGPNGIWRFRAGISGKTIGRIEQCPGQGFLPYPCCQQSLAVAHRGRFDPGHDTNHHRLCCPGLHHLLHPGTRDLADPS